MRHEPRRTRTTIATLAAAVCALALTAAPASAGTVVWAKGTTEIWAMLDDGSYAAPLTSASALGMTSVGDPHVAPDGDIVVFDGGTTRFNHFAGTTFHCGFSCEGVYRWQGGQTVRLSPEPNNGDGEVSTFASEPEIVGGGRYAYGFYGCYGRVGAGFSCEETISTEGLDGTGGRAYGGACTRGPKQPSANPANAAEIAYVGCNDGNGDYGLWVSGENNANTRLVGASDAPIVDPSWRTDGTQIVHLEDGGATPGLWIVQATGAPSFRHVLAAPANSDFRSPRFMGAAQDRILFSAAGELWTVPASCTAATCTFPASATKLTSGADNATPAWSARNLIAPPRTGDDGVPGGGSGGAGGGGLVDTPATQLSLAVPKTRLRTALSKGLTVTVRGGAAGKASVVVREKRTKVASGAKSASKSGTARVKVRFTRSAIRKLSKRRSVKLTFVVTFKPAGGGEAARVTRNVTVKR